MQTNSDGIAVRQVACRLCGQPLEVHLAAVRDGFCRAFACEAERVHRAARAAEQRQWRDYRVTTEERLRQSAPKIAGLARERTGGIEDLTIQTLPRQTLPMAPANPDRREAFRDYLRRIVDASFAEHPEPKRVTGRETNDESEPLLAMAACATCKGRCCNPGGQHNAFLNAGVIAEYRATRPDLNPEQVYDAYASRLPDRSPAGSCHYHGPKGCTLERDQRAQLCNLHHCRPLKYLLHLSDEIADGPVALVSTECGDDIVAMSVVEGDEWYEVEDRERPTIDATTENRIVRQGLDWLPAMSPTLPPERG